MLSGSGSTIFGVLPRAMRVDVPRFEGAHGGPAPKVVLTHSATVVEPVVPVG